MENLEESPGHFKLWRELELHEFKDKFVIKSVESNDQGFSVSRYDGNIENLNGDVSSGAPPNGKVSGIYGVVGTIRLLAGSVQIDCDSNWLNGADNLILVFVLETLKFRGYAFDSCS